MSRYCVGIDLGTTNSALAYTEGGKIKLFRIPQLNAQGVIEPLTTLPSFHYLAEPEELPGSSFAVGQWAKEQGAKVPTRLIHSAKSWLSNSASNRKEKMLPFESADPTRRLTAAEASASYLSHLRGAWNTHFAYPLEEQEVILTVPASFDEVARALTVEAAHLAGIPKLTLLEEPQAAFYAWIQTNEKRLDMLNVGETILVCDVGGGTTDFSLIEVVASQNGVGFQRMAVGKHLLLGGDNMDAALSHHIETQINEELDPSQWLSLRHQSRAAKEAILGGESQYSIWVPGRGSQLVGGGKGIEITEEELSTLLLDGFFGLYPVEEARRHNQKSGIRSVGLPFEHEPSITKHLASFLAPHSKPTYILFNGGSVKPAAFQKRILDSLHLWYADSVEPLVSTHLDLAVAKGAAYYGNVRSGEGVRIGGGSARAYYLGFEDEKVVTLLPRGVEEGTELTSSHTFSLLPNQPVSFQLYHSHTRLGDSAGDILPFEEEMMTPLPPIHTALRFGRSHTSRLPVQLTLKLTEIGTLELWLQSLETAHRWKLEFQLRGYTNEKRAMDQTVDVASLEPAKQKLIDAFAVGAQSQLKVVMHGLEDVLAAPRFEWGPSILRGLFDTLLIQSNKRNLSSAYGTRFWNLAGYFLRPGRGYPLDEFRLKELWKLILADEVQDEQVELQKWICYRRIAAGLSKGQQIQLYSELFPRVYDKKKRRLIVKRKGGYQYAEQIRALASFELVDVAHKEKLGEALVERIVTGHGEGCDFWALGRIGTRLPLYGTVSGVIAAKTVERWIDRLVKIAEPQLVFPLTLLARKTDFRQVNLSSSAYEKVTHFLQKYADPSDKELLDAERELTHREQERCFGDSLPSGLQLELTP